MKRRCQSYPDEVLAHHCFRSDRVGIFEHVFFFYLAPNPTSASVFQILPGSFPWSLNSVDALSPSLGVGSESDAPATGSQWYHPDPVLAPSLFKAYLPNLSLAVSLYVFYIYRLRLHASLGSESGLRFSALDFLTNHSQASYM